DIMSRVQPPLVASNANDERGLLGIAFHPGFNDPTSVGFHTLYTYNSELIPTGTNPTYVAPNGAVQNYKNVINEWKISAADPNPTSANGQYRIPVSNPFQAAGQAPEIYAYGLRNPYRFSFDTANGQLIVADVGQNTIEEIDRVTLGGNFGWAQKEGDFLFNRT